MSTIFLSGLFVQPLTLRVEEWVGEGKLSEEDLERSLGSDARALLDHGMDRADWAPLEVVESLVALAAMQLGGETGLADWAREIALDWREREGIRELFERARSLVDGPGFLVTQLGEALLRDCRWEYEGGRAHFSVRLLGFESATPQLKALLGSLLARLVEQSAGADLDVRLAGVDASELVLFADRPGRTSFDPTSESRLFRAALVAHP